MRNPEEGFSARVKFVEPVLVRCPPLISPTVRPPHQRIRGGAILGPRHQTALVKKVVREIFLMVGFVYEQQWLVA